MQQTTITPPIMEQSVPMLNEPAIERVHPVLAVKRCSCCGEVKPKTEFYAAVNNKDGLQGFCKACHAEKTKANRNKRKNEQTRTELSQFTPRELMQELANRGYKGSLTFTETHTINLEKL